MNAALLRSVMDVTEYKRERQKLQELYGSPDDQIDAIIAKRDQAFAELFYRSGWTQEQLAEQEGKSQPWVSYRLRFGRFIAYATNITSVIFVLPSDLTERRFRSYWETTNKNDDENERFSHVIRSMEIGPPIKSPANKSKKRPSPQRDKAREIVRPLVEAGQPTNPEKLHAEHGLSEISFREGAALEKGRLEGLKEAAEAATTSIDKSLLSKTAQERFTALEHKSRLKLEAEFEDRVQHEVTNRINELVMPFYKERLDKAELLMKAGTPFSNKQFLSLLGALHSDTTTQERRDAAFSLLKDKEVLLRPEEKDRPLTGGLPTTVAELLAMKKARQTSAASSSGR